MKVHQSSMFRVMSLLEGHEHTIQLLHVKNQEYYEYTEKLCDIQAKEQLEDHEDTSKIHHVEGELKEDDQQNRAKSHGARNRRKVLKIQQEIMGREGTGRSRRPCSTMLTGSWNQLCRIQWIYWICLFVGLFLMYLYLMLEMKLFYIYLSNIRERKYT